MKTTRRVAPTADPSGGTIGHTQAEAGVVSAPGNSIERNTGGWRVQRPVVDMDRCTHCMICWVFCPDSAVLAGEGRFLGFRLEHCKGCGICAHECPAKCIEMVPESALARPGGM